jgi:prepilin-type processing-associated H-X9-DG protein
LTPDTILIGEKFLACGDGTPEGAYTTGTAWAWANHDSKFAPAVAMESPWNDGTTFQVLPKPGACDWRYAQTGHREGMNVAAADGHARYISKSTSPKIYKWAMGGITEPYAGPSFLNDF